MLARIAPGFPRLSFSFYKMADRVTTLVNLYYSSEPRPIVLAHVYANLDALRAVRASLANASRVWRKWSAHRDARAACHVLHLRHRPVPPSESRTHLA
jgi:hypothetical protein